MDVRTQSIPVCNVVLYLWISFIIYFPTVALKQISNDAEIHKIVFYPARIKCLTGDTSAEKLFLNLLSIGGVSILLRISQIGRNPWGLFCFLPFPLVSVQSPKLKISFSDGREIKGFLECLFNYLNAKQLNENMKGNEKINKKVLNRVKKTNQIFNFLCDRRNLCMDFHVVIDTF